ncbi:MAG: SRPBCC family protein [Pseudomonadales bacterium]|jgi:hypothetical protein
MTTVKVVESIKAEAKAVWDILGDFGGIKVGGPITAFEIEGEGVGAVRTITMGGANVVERLEAFDPESFSLTYAIINEDSPLPVSAYRSDVQITANDEGCTIDWTGNFEPKGVSEEQASEIVKGIYTGGIARARKALES